jgi:TPR repeat protein
MKKFFVLFLLLFQYQINECISSDILQSEDISNFTVKKIIEISDYKHLSINLGRSFRQAAESFNYTDAFWNEELSNTNWQKKLSLLKMARELGDKEASSIFEQDIESKKYSRDYTDLLIAGYEDKCSEKEIRAFFWEHLAYADQDERLSLINAYKKGDLVNKNEQRAIFWENYK